MLIVLLIGTNLGEKNFKICFPSTLAVTTGVGIAQIVLTAIGDSATVMWTGAQGWAVIGTGGTTAAGPTIT